MNQYEELDKIGFVGTGKHDRDMDHLVSKCIQKRKAKRLDSDNIPKVAIRDKAL